MMSFDGLRSGLALALALGLLLCHCHVEANDNNKTTTANRAEATASVTIPNHEIGLRVGSSDVIEIEVAVVPGYRYGVVYKSSPSGHIGEIDDDILGPDEHANVTVTGEAAGETTLTIKVKKSKDKDKVDTSQAFVKITVFHSDILNVISTVIGWIYFFAWSISFYPQIYENWKRKSVIGLNFDFLSLNVVGFFLYSSFNIGLYWVQPLQNEYFNRHPHSLIPVQLNDVIFSIHAFFACVLTIYQCLIYERGQQSVSRICRAFLFGVACFLLLCLFLSSIRTLHWLDLLYYASYVKLLITLIKYIPQAVMNYRRKSTVGWSIGNILLDFTGGTLSMGQMFIMSYNNDDWDTIFGDPTKFGLGLFSVLFDIVFILQHYVFYRNAEPREPLLDNETGTGEEESDPLTQ